ncbi:division/cell wall cluster transcriptional repressor MraZ [Candidatus Poribacteria bacterium]
MFVGKAEHTANKDGRVSIPSKMRDVIKKKYDAEDLYLVLIQGNIVCLYPGQEFEKLTEALLANPAGANLQSVMDIERFCADAEPCKLDGSGRIVITPSMRQSAGIDQDVMVVGAMTHIEIWDPKRWAWSREQARSGVENIRTFPVQAGAGQQRVL